MDNSLLIVLEIQLDLIGLLLQGSGNVANTSIINSVVETFKLIANGGLS